MLYLQKRENKYQTATYNMTQHTIIDEIALIMAYTLNFNIILVLTFYKKFVT
jgi:hypothetical protein